MDINEDIQWEAIGEREREEREAIKVGEEKGCLK